MGATVVQLTESKKQIQHTHRVFEDQKKAFRNNPMPSLAERHENLKRVSGLTSGVAVRVDKTKPEWLSNCAQMAGIMECSRRAEAKLMSRERR